MGCPPRTYGSRSCTDRSATTASSTRRLFTTELQPRDPATGAYTGEIVIGLPGAYGVTARVIPVHPDLANTFDLGLVAWAN